jgi:hypothetical protein
MPTHVRRSALGRCEFRDASCESGEWRARAFGGGWAWIARSAKGWVTGRPSPPAPSPDAAGERVRGTPDEGGGVARPDGPGRCAGGEVQRAIPGAPRMARGPATREGESEPRPGRERHRGVRRVMCGSQMRRGWAAARALTPCPLSRDGRGDPRRDRRRWRLPWAVWWESSAAPCPSRFGCWPTEPQG